ncbi:MAG: DVU_1556 family methyltransferase [Clostridiaceae bacterium]
MSDCSCANIYENKALRESLGETLRPGGFSLTKRALAFTNLNKGCTVMDVGSGLGDTVNFLQKEYGIDAIGLEPSDLLRAESGKKYPGIRVEEGKGEKIPAKDGSFDGIFAECTLSLMDDLDAMLKESSRTLKKGGYFVAADVYARRPEHLPELQKFTFNSCLRGMLNLERLKEKLKSAGFKIIISEDQTECLRQLTVKLIFEYGSMGVFWSKMSGCGGDGEEFRNLLSKCKAGYFLLVCIKN